MDLQFWSSLSVLLYKTFRKLKEFFSPEHLAMTEAFNANLSNGKSLYINETFPVSMNSFFFLEKLRCEI